MKNYLTIVCFILSLNTTSQDFNSLIQHLKIYNLEILDKNLNDYNLSKIEKLYFRTEIDHIKTKEIKAPLSLNHKSKTPKINILNNILLGDYHLFKNFAQDSLSLDFYRQSLNISLKLKDTILISESLKRILKQLSENRSANKISNSYLMSYSKYLYDDNEKATYLYYKHVTNASIERKEKISQLKEGLSIANKTKNDYLKAKYNQMIGLFFSYFKKENDSALVYMNRAKLLLEKKPYQYYLNELFGVYGNIGQYEEKKGNYLIAREYYEKANKIKVPKYRYIVKVKLNEVLAKNANIRGLKDSAYYYLKQSNLYKDTLNEFNKAKALIDLDKKYKTAEKDKLILKQEAENQQKIYLLIAAILTIITGSIIYFLSLKNSKRKIKLAEQEKKLETQKNLTLLKEQEITTINAMVDGQEKERKQIAEDLHDNLGSVLATLKLHFENLKINRERKKINQEELFNKTETLIDEAYLKVRSIAHAKNAGVIANQGLLRAIQMMAEKISSADKINIEVIDYGLDKRLENSIEITVFRIIQELVTNIIKHAEAKNATINLSLYEKNLNIIIEDDGKGFDIKKVDLNNGMGISSIKTRVEHLEGTFSVDATLGKGSSIILDIPIS